MQTGTALLPKHGYETMIQLLLDKHTVWRRRSTAAVRCNAVFLQHAGRHRRCSGAAVQRGWCEQRCRSTFDRAPRRCVSSRW